MRGDPILGDQYAVGDVVQRKVCDGVAAWFVKRQHVLAVGDPVVTDTHPHPPAQRLGEQQVLGHRLRGQKWPIVPAPERTLLPCQSHCPVLLSIRYA